MPINGLMTLGDVVEAGNRGRDDRQRQDQYQRGLKQQQVGDAAGARAQEAFQKAMQGGGDRDVAMLKATEEYSRHFAENGQWQEFLKHEAAVQPQRMRVRAQALQNFQAEGGASSPEAVKKLLARVYATVPDGNDIADVEMLPGGAPVDRGTAPTAAKMAPASVQQGLATFDQQNTNPLGAQAAQAAQGPAPIIEPGRPGDGRLGAPSGPAAVRVRLSNGEVRPVDLSKMLSGIMQSLQDPVKAAEAEIKLNYERALQGVKTDGTLKVEEAKSGFQAKRDEAKAKADKERGLAVAEVGRQGRVEAAKIGATSRETVAETRATGSGGGGRGGANSVQSRTVDKDGYVILNFKDGTSKRATVDGKAVRSGDWSKRVDSMAKEMAKTTEGMRKPMGELRQQAEQMLMGEAPALAPASGGKDYSNLWGGKQ